MKFLVTGTLRDRTGLRRLVALTLLLFLAFTAAHFTREVLATGLSPAEVRRNLHGIRAGETGQLQAPKSPLIVFEDLHVDLLLHTMVLLFVCSLMGQSRYGRRTRDTATVALFGLLLLYEAARMTTVFAPGFAYTVGTLTILYHACLTLAILLMLIDLFAPHRPSGRETPPGAGAEAGGSAEG